MLLEGLASAEQRGRQKRGQRDLKKENKGEHTTAACGFGFETSGLLLGPILGSVYKRIFPGEWGWRRFCL